MVDNLDTSKKQVLVVEDSKIMVKIYQTQFNNSPHLQDYQLSTCKSAPDALIWLKKYAEVHNSLPDIILLDWIMPGKYDGLDLLQFIKKNDSFKKIPVIMVSSVEDKLKIVTAMKAGVNDYLMKPLNVKTLIEKVVKFTTTQVA